MSKFSRKKPSGICHMYRRLLERLPSTYPQSKLIVHATLTDLSDCYYKGNKDKDPGDPGHPPFGYCDGNDNSIHVAVQLNRESKENIYWYLLHEMGHLYAYQRYGSSDKRWKNYQLAERYANQFAWRWVNKLKDERWM